METWDLEKVRENSNIFCGAMLGVAFFGLFTGFA
jgi:hypothetical protein